MNEAKEHTIPYTDNLFTETQLKVLFALPILPGILSVLASLLILYVIGSDAKRKLRHVYHRVLAAYSILDVVISSQYIVSSFVVPVGTPGVYGARGNWSTCRASGFIMQFSSSMGLYVAFICLYYMLIVKYGIREQTIAKKLEIYVHMFAFFFPFVMGVCLIRLDMYAPTNLNPGHCFINVYPANCLRVEEVECQRGEDYKRWNLASTFPQVIYFFVVLVSSVLTYRTVLTTLRKQNRWSFSRSTFLTAAATTANRHGAAPRRSSMNERPRRLSIMASMNVGDRLQRRNSSNGLPSPSHDRLAETTQQTLVQAMLYIFSFFVTYLPFGLIFLAFMVGVNGTEENRTFYFCLVSLLKILQPSTGIWNFFIFCRPRLHALRKTNPDTPSLVLLRQIILHSRNDVPSPNRRNPAVGRTANIAAILQNGESSVRDDNDEGDFTPELYAASPEPECNEGGTKQPSAFDRSNSATSAVDLDDEETGYR